MEIRMNRRDILALALLLLMGTRSAVAATDIIPASALVQPADLAGELKTSKPTILQVGFSKL
jgi:hypothetical protein